MDNSAGLHQIKCGSQTLLRRKDSAASISTPRCAQTLRPFAFKRSPYVSVPLSLLTSSETAANDAGPGNEVPQCSLIRVGNHASFRRAVRPTSFDNGVLWNRKIKRVGHDCNQLNLGASPRGVARIDCLQAMFQKRRAWRRSFESRAI